MRRPSPEPRGRQCDDVISSKELLVQRPSGRSLHTRRAPPEESSELALLTIHRAGIRSGSSYANCTICQAKLDAAAAALAQLPVNVIAAFGTPRAKAAQRATKIIPIVAISISDPVKAGLVTSLAHPGGNITGNTILGPDI